MTEGEERLKKRFDEGGRRGNKDQVMVEAKEVPRSSRESGKWEEFSWRV